MQYDPEETYFANRVPTIAAQLAEAGVTRGNASSNTFVYISAETGLWTAMDLATPDGEPSDYFGRGGYRLGSLDGGWLRYL